MRIWKDFTHEYAEVWQQAGQPDLQIDHWVIELGEEEKHETNTKCTKSAWEVVVKIFSCENIVKYQLWGIISD